jgi:hypothetical protein
MKVSNKYFKPIGLLVVLALMVVSCTEFEEFQSKTYGSGPTITLAQVAVQDSTFTVSVTSSADGYASVILLPGTGNTPPEDPEDLATGNLNAMAYQSKKVTANTAKNFTFTGLVQDAAYEVMAVGTNLDGKYSDVSTLAVGTDDTYPPVLVGTSPSTGYTPILPVDGSVDLIFDEPVIYDNTKDLVFREFYDAADVVAGSVTVSGNTATVTLGENLTYRDYVLLSYPEGAFTDLSGNPVAAMDSHPDGSTFVGLFWRAEAMVYDPESIAPAETVVPADFDIVITFPDSVHASRVTDGDITLTYDDGRDVLIRSVLASEVSTAGNDLTITQSYTAGPGVSVTLNIPAEILDIGINNPNAVITSSWSIELTLADLVGTYTVEAAYLSNPAYDEVWTATVALVSGNDTALSITIDAGAGGGIAFLAGFDVNAWTILIPEATDAGDLYGFGPTLIIESDGSTYVAGDVHGIIMGGSSFSIDLMGLYLPDYDWGDGTYGALQGAFNTSWTKTAKKAAPVGSFPASRIPHFKRF